MHEQFTRTQKKKAECIEYLHLLGEVMEETLQYSRKLLKTDMTEHCAVGTCKI